MRVSYGTWRCLWQVSASTVRNLSWRADSSSKLSLREAGTATALMQAAMMPSNEQTLKSILSALWNVSAHCIENKAAICAVPGSLEFLVGLLEYRSSSKSLAVIENSGGILRNMSSFVALHEEHRRTLRRTGVYQLLLRQLGSPSLTVVSNACGSLWNLSARSAEDQQRLRDLGAVGLLRSLVNSKHKMIAMGSTAALKNLLVPRSNAGHVQQFEKQPGAKMPGLHARRQRSLDRDFERHSNADDLTAGLTHQSFGTGLQPHSNSWVMSSSAGGNLFLSGVRPVLTDQVEESKWRRVVDPANMKIANSPAVTGSASYTHGIERTFYDTQSVDNSPAIHRRVPVHGISSAVSSSLDYGVRNPVSRSYNGWAAGVQASNDAVFDHLSRRMERVHFTDLPDCSSQDEPINFSMKYKESTDSLGVPTVQRASSSAVVMDGSGHIPAAQQQMSGSPMSRFHFSRQSLPNGRSNNLVNRTRSQTSQVASGYSKSQFTGSNATAAAIQFEAQKFAASYGRSCMDMERPTNYSLQYAENYEDDNCSGGQFSEQPIDYSTRYMETQTCRPPVFHQDEHLGLYADTIKTFCTEGTPMNYQSTATSMTDLSNGKSNKNSSEFQRRTHSSDDLDIDEVQDFSRKYSEPQTEDKENQNTTYRWSQQRIEVPAFSHVDSGTNDVRILSPGEQPRQYCTEGSPPNFSHSGSLNILDKSDVIQTVDAASTIESGPPASTVSAAFNKPAGEKLPSRSAVANGDGTTGVSSAKVESHGEMAETKDVTHGKTVTFEVEQTPLMFSRSSSLGSLSSFDIRSVHSSVMSEYSVRASQVVSPSELPDSPGNTLPPSPSKSTHAVVFFGPDMKSKDESSNSHAADNNDVNASSVLTDAADTSAMTVLPLIGSDQSSMPVTGSNHSSVGNYCYEGGNMSSRTSLSALTCDGEHIHLCKEPRSLPLGEENVAMDQSAVAEEPLLSVNININNDVDIDDDGVDSPVNKDDEMKLAECISLGMPPRRKKGSSNRMMRSHSDGECLRSQSNPTLTSQIATGNTVTASASYNKMNSVINQQELLAVKLPDPETFNSDSPRKFAMEDTPLNFSQSGSLSDLSSVAGIVTVEPARNAVASATVTLLDTTATSSTAAAQDDDSDVSLSDDDVPGEDELLSHLIAAAMPKKRQHWKPAVHASNIRGRPPVSNGPVDGMRRPISRSLEPPMHRASRSNVREFHGFHSHVTDSRRNELTGKKAIPIQTAVRVPATDVYKTDAPTTKPLAFDWTAEPSEDHMLSYAVEGTPDSYSRDRSPTLQRVLNTPAAKSSLLFKGTDDGSWNSSLSSLSFDSSLNTEPTAEESALLQECINAALPKTRGGKKSTKKSSSSSHDHQPLRTSPSGSSESSFKHRPPVNIASIKSEDALTNLNISEESKSEDMMLSNRQLQAINDADDVPDILQESLPDVGLSDIALEDESLPSGPSTEANNTVVYCGPALTEPGSGQTTVNAVISDVEGGRF